MDKVGFQEGSNDRHPIQFTLGNLVGSENHQQGIILGGGLVKYG